MSCGCAPSFVLSFGGTPHGTKEFTVKYRGTIEDVIAGLANVKIIDENIPLSAVVSQDSQTQEWTVDTAPVTGFPARIRAGTIPTSSLYEDFSHVIVNIEVFSGINFVFYPIDGTGLTYAAWENSRVWVLQGHYVTDTGSFRKLVWDFGKYE